MRAKLCVRVGTGAMMLCCLLFFAVPSRVAATTGVNQELSFEGKVVTAAGLNIVDGTYNMEFKIYTAAGACNPTTGVGCTLGWTEDWLVSGGNGVALTSGTYQVNLDAVAANNFSGIDFNSYPLYLSLQIGSTSSCTPAGNFQANCGGDGEMKPYILLTATPYALNSNLLNGLTSSAFGQLASSQTWTGTNTFQPTTNISSLIVKQTSGASPSADIFKVQSANSSNIIQVTGPSANNAAVAITSLGANAITLTSGAALTFTGTAASTWDIGANTLSLQTANNGAITTGTGVLTIGGNQVFSGTTARSITGPGTGGLAVTVDSGPLTLSTTTSGALSITAASSSTWQVGGANQNLTIQTSGTGTLALDTAGAGTLSLGTVNASVLNLYSNDIAHTIHIADGGATTAQAITIGSVGSTSSLTLKSGTGNINLSPKSGGNVIYNQGAGSNLQLTASAVPTVDQLAISNVGQGVTTAGVNGLSVNYVGGSAAVESGAIRIDFAPGGTSGGTWNGLRIVANATGAASGVNEYGIKLEGPSSPGSGTEIGVKLTTGFDIGLDIGSGGLQLATMSNPTAPAANNLKVYSKLINGRAMLKSMDPTGVNYPLQPSLFQNQVAMINASTGASAPNVFGTGATTAGTANTAAYNEAYGYMGGYNTSGTINTTAGFGNATSMFARGSTTGANGFFAMVRGALQDATYTNVRIFIGMSDQTVANSVAAQNQAGNRAGFSYDTGRSDVNWKFSTKDNTTENLVDTGMVFSAAAAYDWYVFTPAYPNNTTVYWRIDNMTAGTTAEGTATTNLPTGSTAMRMTYTIRNLTAVLHNIWYQRMYVESDR